MSEVVSSLPLRASVPLEGKGLFVSQKAESHLLTLIKGEQLHFNRLRVSVNGGGCAGFQYMLKFDSEVSNDDIIFFSPLNIEIVIDKVSYNIIEGATIDYVEEMIGAAFVIKNPNATSACGCGNSFSVI